MHQPVEDCIPMAPSAANVTRLPRVGTFDTRERLAFQTGPAAGMNSPTWPVSAGSARIVVYGLPR
jgi:hypothetical protein